MTAAEDDGDEDAAWIQQQMTQQSAIDSPLEIHFKASDESVQNAKLDSDEAWVAAQISQPSAVQDSDSVGWQHAQTAALQLDAQSSSDGVHLIDNEASRQVALRWLTSHMPLCGSVLHKLQTCKSPDAPSAVAQFFIDSLTEPSAIAMVFTSTFVAKPGVLEVAAFASNGTSGAALISAVIGGRSALLVHSDSSIVERELHSRLTASGLEVSLEIRGGLWILRDTTTIPDDPPLAEVRMIHLIVTVCCICLCHFIVLCVTRLTFVALLAIRAVLST